MSQLNDLMFSKLGATYDGALPDMIDQFKAAQPAWINWDEFLAAAGFVDGTLSERKYDYFDAL